MKQTCVILVAGFVAFQLASDQVCAADATTAFTVQGQLKQDGSNVNATAQFRYQLWDAATGGNAVSSAQTATGVVVQDGIFSNIVDFGDGAFNQNAVWMSVEVKLPSDPDFVMMSARQQVTNVPMSTTSRGLRDTFEAPETGEAIFRGPSPSNELMSMQFNGTNFSMETSQDAGATSMAMKATSSDSSSTMFSIDNQTNAFTFSASPAMAQREGGTGPGLQAEGSSDDAMAVAGGYTPSVRVTLDQSANAVNMSAFEALSGPSFNMISQGPGASRTAFIVDDTTSTFRFESTPALAEGEGGSTSALLNTALVIKADQATISQFGGPTIEPSAGGPALPVVFKSASGIRTPRVKIDSGIASNIAGSGSSAELVINGAVLELQVDGDTVDRWTGVGESGDGVTPNRISGYPGNTISGATTYGSSIGGGGADGLVNTVTGPFSAIVGGRLNTVSGPGGFIGGGYGNTISNQSCTIGGGGSNTASGDGSTIAGGGSNIASDTGATVGGGFFNTTIREYSTVGGGLENTASGAYSVVPGGYQCEAGGHFSFAGGRRAHVRSIALGDAADDDGTFIWADAEGNEFISNGANKFLVRATGGTTFYSNFDFTAGVTLAAGGSAWASVSDKHLKENFVEVDGRQLLERLAQVPVSTWNYKSQDAAIRHIGVMAQDFYAAFGVGEEETKITTIDADGVALAAIQGLNEIVQEKNCEIEDLKVRNADLEARLVRIEQLLNGQGVLGGTRP